MIQAVWIVPLQEHLEDVLPLVCTLKPTSLPKTLLTAAKVRLILGKASDWFYDR